MALANPTAASCRRKIREDTPIGSRPGRSDRLLSGPLANLFARQSQGIQSCFDVLDNGQPRKEGEVWNTIAMPFSGPEEGPAVKDFAFGRLYQAGGDAQQRRFSGS